MTLDVLLTGIGALVTAIIGITLVIKELRRRDRAASSRQIDELAHSLTITRQDVIAYQQWAYNASELMVANHVHPPDMPPIHAAAPEEDPRDDRRQSRRQRRRGRRAERKTDQTQQDIQPIAQGDNQKEPWQE